MATKSKAAQSKATKNPVLSAAKSGEKLGHNAKVGLAVVGAGVVLAGGMVWAFGKGMFNGMSK